MKADCTVGKAAAPPSIFDQTVSKACTNAGYVIFGATGGIGSALASRLVQQGGASVMLCGRNEDKLKELADKIGGGTPFVADVLDNEAAGEAVKKLEADAGAVTGVANCVGSLTLKTLHATSAQEVHCYKLSFRHTRRR